MHTQVSRGALYKTRAEKAMDHETAAQDGLAATSVARERRSGPTIVESLAKLETKLQASGVLVGTLDAFGQRYDAQVIHHLYERGQHFLTLGRR